jgi:hypothetical protein
MAWRGPDPYYNPTPNQTTFDQAMSEMRASENRAYAVRRDADLEKDFSITLMDIDTTIFNHLDLNINPSIINAGQLVKVPVNYASPERWKAITVDGVLRDKNGKIQCPAIAMRRSTMQRNDNLITFNRYLRYPAIKKFSQKNQYDRFSVMSEFKPVQELYSVACPDHIIINYDFTVWTDYIEQANSVIEKINWATEDYWGDPNKFKFRTTISDFQFQTEVPADSDRIVRTTFTMMCYAYLLPESFASYKSSTQKSFTARKIVFGAETVQEISTTGTTLTDISIVNGNPVPVIDNPNMSGSYTANVGSEYINSKVLNYQSLYQTKSGSVITIDDGSGSAQFLFPNTSLRSESIGISDYQKVLIILDNLSVPSLAISYYETGSDFVVSTKNKYLLSQPTTSSLIIAYGNFL